MFLDAILWPSTVSHNARPLPAAGVMFGSLINGAARNPNIAKQLVGYALLGFALTESIALFSLLVVFLILFA